MKNNINLEGGCHCKSVRFVVQGKSNIDVLKCNCSICSLTSYLHYIVPKSKFRLAKGKKYLTTYKFNKNIAKHYFCKKCGIKSFYVPRSHPNYLSVNARCFDEGIIKRKKIIKFDGKNWEKSINALKNIKELI